MENQNSIESSVVLIIEDDPLLSKLYARKFTQEGFSPLVALDGETGLDIAIKNKVDIILLDLMLPRLSGIEVLEKLRQDPKGREIKVLALTNISDPNEKKKVMDLGAKDYLVKAKQSPEEVVKSVKHYLEN